MLRNGIDKILRDIRTVLAQSSSEKEFFDSVSRLLGEVLSADGIQVVRAGGTTQDESYLWRRASLSEEFRLPFDLIRLENAQLHFHDTPVTKPFFVSDLSYSIISRELARELGSAGVCSFALVPLYAQGRADGWLAISHLEHHYRWGRDEALLLAFVAECFGVARLRAEAQATLLASHHAPKQGESDKVPLLVATSTTPQERVVTDEQSARIEAFLRLGGGVVAEIQEDGTVVSVSGDLPALLGVSVSQITSDSTIWGRLISQSDRGRFFERVRRAQSMGIECEDELALLHQVSGARRWFSVHATPSPMGEHQREKRWTLRAFDITRRKLAEEELAHEKRRVAALYEISRALQMNHDPAVVSLRGLKAVMKALSADGGFACLYDPLSKALELVAAEGVPEVFLDALPTILMQESLVRSAAQNNQEYAVADMQSDQRARFGIAKLAQVRSALIVPFSFEHVVLGVLVVFCHDADRFGEADVQLGRAAARHIGMATHQAELYAAEKLHATSLAALYRLSHEASKHLSTKEVAEHAIPIVQQELVCKRMWMGVLNEQGTHIVGQAGFGPGIRRQVIQVQVELSLRHDFFDQAVRTKQPVIVEAGAPMECSGLNRIVKRLGLGTFVIVPLVSLGQVVGVLVVEPALPSSFFAQRRLPLLTSMANEIATVILARRFEGRMAAADKMRMAGMLASGIAHNFNNMLQAIMGQASLIEMQLPKDSNLMVSSRMITAAATKGAALIKQLLSFSSPGSYSPADISLNDTLGESQMVYRSVLGADIALDLQLGYDVPQVRGDLAQIQQILTNLFANAREAIGNKRDGRVVVTTTRVRVGSGEVDPDLAPGEYVRIDVEDNGVGMDDEKQARCFEPFYTTKNVDLSTGLGFGGFGLGLSAAYAIARHHDGFLSVNSQPGEGSVFSLYLPTVALLRSVAAKEGVIPPKNREEPYLITYRLAPEAELLIEHSGESLGLSIVRCAELERVLEQFRLSSGGLKVVVCSVARSEADFFKAVASLPREVTVVVLAPEISAVPHALRMRERFVLLSESPNALEINRIVQGVMNHMRTLGKKVHIERNGSQNGKDEHPSRSPPEGVVERFGVRK